MLFGGALRIQRLEGSRPQGSLCTLNGCEVVQRDRERTESGGCDGRKGGWSCAVALRGLIWRRESLASEGFCRDETRSRHVRRSTSRSRGWEQRFKRRTCLVEVASEAGVARRRAVRGRAWLRRRLGSSRVRGSDRRAVMPPKQASCLSCRAVESITARAQRDSGWRGIRSCGCARIPGEGDGAGSGAGTHELAES